VYKGDYYVSPNHVLTGTYNYIKNPTQRPDASSSTYTTKPPIDNTVKDHLLSLSWRWTVRPTLINELRGGFLRANSSFLANVDFPKFLVGGLLFSNPVNTFLEQGRQINTYHVQDNATWLKGSHELTFGFQTQILHVSPFNDGGKIPTYNLGISTANTNGFSIADFPGGSSSNVTSANNLYANLAGFINTATQTFNVTSTTSGYVPGATNLRQLQNSIYSGYVQDKWKVRPNLTLTLGMRYEYWKPMDEKNGLYLLPKLQNNDPKASVLDPNAVLDFAGGPSGRKFYSADANNFAPNIGFAWAPFKDGKTSVRGGYSISYVNDNLSVSARSIVGYSAGLSSTGSLTGQTGLLANPPTIPTPTFKVPRTLADNRVSSATGSTGMPDPNLVTPYVHQWSIGIERDVKGTLLAARYIGNRGSALLRQLDYNQVLYNANGFLADFQRAQSNASRAEAAGLGYVGTYNPSIAGSQPLTVFPLLLNGGTLTNSTNQTYLKQGRIGEMANQYQITGANGSVNFYTNPSVQSAYVLTNSGYSNYHALQLEMTRRTRSGLLLQFNYNFSKGLSNTAGDHQAGLEPQLDNANPGIEYARSPYDLRHVLKANYYYELPYGSGKRWSGNSLMNKVLGGWAISGIWSYQSGTPYSILSNFGTLNRDARSAGINTASVNGTTMDTLGPLTSGVFMTGDGPYFLSPTLISEEGRGATPPGGAPFAGQVFFHPNAGTVGNLQRRMFSGPWQWSYDASVIKQIRFRERHTVDLHFDFFNFMNHPTFFIPPATTGDYSSVSAGVDSSNYGINGTSFGVIDSMNYLPRVIQIGAYYKF